MTTEIKTATKRKKPKFFRQDWSKKIKFGKTIKKLRKWRAAKGGDSKVRLRERGHAARPAIGWGSDKAIRDKIQGLKPIRVENLKQLEGIKKDQGIIIGKIGKKKRKEIMDKANQMKIKILNKYKKKSGAKPDANND